MKSNTTINNKSVSSWQCGGCGTWYSYIVTKCDCCISSKIISIDSNDSNDSNIILNNKKIITCQ
jgi:hypothetical protein